MPQSLADFVHEHRLRPGQSIRERVNGFTAELRVPRNDEPSPELVEQVMLTWPTLDVPYDAARTVTVAVSEGPWPDPPVIVPDEDGAE